MKNLILISLLSLFSQSVFSQIPNYVPANGLVGWWPFNGNANDESGNGNNGSPINGANLTSDRFGNLNKAFNFDGNDDYIELNNQFSDWQDFSFSLWINHLKGSNYSGLISDANTFSANDLFFNINASDVGLKADKNGSTLFSCSLPEVGFNNTPLVTNQTFQGTWKHLVLTVSNNSIKIYVNGILVGIVFSSASNIGYHAIKPVFGKITDGAYSIQFLQGLLDDIGIWNRALTDCEIQDLYHSQLGFTTIDAGPNQTVCKGDSVTLNGSGGIFLSWNNGVIDSFPFAPLQTDSYVLTGADTLGCVGTDTVNITVLNPTTSTQSATALDSYTWQLNNQTYTQSGTYTATIPNAAGCDSVVTLNLTLNFTGISENSEAQISISPNPASDNISLKVSELLLGKNYLIYDNSGRKIMEGIISQKEMVIKIGAFDDGIYLIKVNNEIQNTFRIIKQ
jgi:hypothetical protein